MSARDYRMLIGSEMISASEVLDVVNPADGAPFAACPRASLADLDRAVAVAKGAYPAWKAVPIDTRRAKLRQAAGIIARHADELAGLFTREQGRPTRFATEEILGAAYWFQATADLDLPVDVIEDTDLRRIEVHHVPLGVVCAIVPWNFPVLLFSFKVAPALLTGNTVVLKPSPFTPLCTLRIGELLKDVFPPGVLNIISGGDELGPQMTAHPGFSKITFTGSTSTGKRVMESAARDLKRITLELGGNDAAIVMPDVDVDSVSERLFEGAFSNTAQICVATKRLYVHEDIYDAVRDKLHGLAKAAIVGDGAEQGSRFGPIQNKAQYERVKDLLRDAEETGLQILRGGPVPTAGYFVPLTIVDNPPDTARVVREEAFGPILPMMKFRELSDVIRRVNDSEYGLAGAVWSRDIELAQKIAAEMETGTVWINQNLQSTPYTPLTGHKHSGFGSENGVYGLREFTLPKAVYIPKDVPAAG